MRTNTTGGQNEGTLRLFVLGVDGGATRTAMCTTLWYLPTNSVCYATVIDISLVKNQSRDVLQKSSEGNMGGVPHGVHSLDCAHR